MTQWHWVAEGVPDRSLAQTLLMMRNGAFLVGLTQHVDASLMLFRHFMGLFIEDILYFSLNTRQHPALSDWHPDVQARVHQWVHDCGDGEYYRTAQEVFEHQVAAYGGWDRLRTDTDMFVDVNRLVNTRCAHVALPSEAHAVYSRTVCLVAQYRQLGLAARFGEL